MFSFQRRLQKLVSAPDFGGIVGDFERLAADLGPSAAAAPDPDGPAAPRSPDSEEDDRSAAAAPDFDRAAAAAQDSDPDFDPDAQLDGKENARSFSLIIRGISKKHSSPGSLQHTADSILRRTFRFFPRCQVFVDKVFYCLDIDGDMAILFFVSELMSELLFQLCRDRSTSPFAIAGKKFSLERNYDQSRQYRKIEAFASSSPPAAFRFVLLSGIPKEWESRSRIRGHFNRILKEDSRSKPVLDVHVFPGAAFVELESQLAIDRIYKKDPKVVSDIGQQMVACAGVKALPLWRVPKSAFNEKWVLDLQGAKRDSSAIRDAPTGLLERQGPDRGPSGRTCTAPQGRRNHQQQQQQLDVVRDKPSASPSPEKPKPIRDRADPVPMQEDHRNIHSDQDQDQQNSEFTRLRQCSLMIGGFSKEKFDAERLAQRFASMMKMFQVQDEAQVEVLWVSSSEVPMGVFDSSGVVDRLMDNFIQFPNEFILDGVVFWLYRPEGYSRPGAVYRNRTAAATVTEETKLVTFDGYKSHWHSEQFKAALVEALERTLLKTGVLERNKPLFKGLVFKFSKLFVELDAAVADAVVSVCLSLTVYLQPLSVYTSPEQVLLIVSELPQRADVPSRLSCLLGTSLRTRARVDPVTVNIFWSSPTSFTLFCRTEAVANALMDAYVNYTQDFCVPDIPLVLTRHPNYVRPGAVYRDDKVAAVDPPDQLWQVEMTGIFPELEPVPVMGAVSELVERALAGGGVLQRRERPFKLFYWEKWSTVARLVVDEAIAGKLVGVTGLTLARYPVGFTGLSVFTGVVEQQQQQEAVIAGLYQVEQDYHQDHVQEEHQEHQEVTVEQTGTGGWIEDDD